MMLFRQPKNPVYVDYNRICPECNKRSLKEDATMDWIDIERCTSVKCKEVKNGKFYRSGKASKAVRN